MVIELDPFECPKLTLLNLCLWSCLKSEVYKRKVDTRHDFIARILDAAARVKKCDYELFSGGLQSELGLMVGCAKIYCKL